MADLIDRKTALDAIKQTVWLTKDAKEVLQEAIEKLPSADIDLSGFSDKLWKTAYERGKADAVRHGHWLRTGRTNVYGGFEVECSVCNDNVMITNIEYEHYCRNCGARMDEGSE